MFGKRSTPSLPGKPATPALSATPSASEPARSSAAEFWRQAYRPADRPEAGKLFSHEVDDLRLADRGDRSGRALQARSGKRARRNPRHRSRNRRDQESGAVDRRTGRPARRYLQRRAGLWPARTAAGARRYRRHHGQRPASDVHRSRRQNSAHQHPLPRQRSVDEHLPAHRQPGRTPRRRGLADLRRASHGRFARQRDRPAARDRRRRAHDPQIQEGQADSRSVDPVRRDLACRARKSSKSLVACAAMSSSPAAPVPARRHC